MLLLFSIIANTINAQWTIKESDLENCNLNDIIKTKPYLVHVIPDDEWETSNFASEKDLQWFKEAKYGMFIHFGLSTFVNKDLSWGIISDRVLPDRLGEKELYPRNEWTSWADSLKLENFSQEELIKIIKESGVKYVVVIAKHHDGFHLWDTKYSDFKSTNSPYKKDFVREVVDACHKCNIKVGIYYSQRDWYHPDYQPIDPDCADRILTPPFYKLKENMTLKSGDKHKKYIDYQFNVVRELCTNYGKIDIFWFDASYWGGMFTAEMWDAERLTRMIRELQPGILINNRAGLPGDFDTPEQRIGMFQNRRPWETCMTLCGSWSYSLSPVKSSLDIFQKLQSTAIGDGNLLLSWGMKWDGSWDTEQKNNFVEVGNYLKKYGQTIYNTQGGPWLPKVWGGTTFCRNKIYVHVVKKTDSDQIFLPKIKDIQVISSKDISGHKLLLQSTDSGYIVDMKHILKIYSPVILELTVNRDLTKSDIELSKNTLTEKNNVLSSQELLVNKVCFIQFDDDKLITKVRVDSLYNQTGKLDIYVSKDGNVWNKYGTISISGTKMDIPLNHYEAGALLDGIKTKYMKFILNGKWMEKKIFLSVYGE